MDKININWPKDKFFENLEFIINDYIMLSRDFKLYETWWLSWKWGEVKTIHKHSHSKFPKVFELLLKWEIEEFPEDLLSELEKIITKLRELYKVIKKLWLNEKEKVLGFIQSSIEAKQKELWFILPDNFKEIFLKALQLDKVEYIPENIVEEARSELDRIMKL